MVRLQHWPAAPPFRDGKDPIRPVVVSGGRKLRAVYPRRSRSLIFAAQKGINQFGNFSEDFTAAPRVAAYDDALRTINRRWWWS
jgi:hypothetical protein